MKRHHFQDLLAQTCDDLSVISSKKGKEYAQNDDADGDVLANFKASGEDVGVLPITALYFALNKHFRSIQTYIKDKQLGKEREYSEDIRGRIRDAQLYLVLLEALVIETEGRAITHVVTTHPAVPGTYDFKVEGSGFNPKESDKARAQPKMESITGVGSVPPKVKDPRC